MIDDHIYAEKWLFLGGVTHIRILIFYIIYYRKTKIKLLRRTFL